MSFSSTQPQSKLQKNEIVVFDRQRTSLQPQPSKQTPQKKQENASDNSDGGELSDLIIKVNKILFSAKTVFPFDFFPDQLTIDPLKVTIRLREFFKSEEIRSILIKDINNVTVDTSVYLATMRIFQAYDPGNPITIRSLKSKDAVKAQNIIQGLVALCREKVNIVDVICAPNGLQHVLEIGKSHEEK